MANENTFSFFKNESEINNVWPEEKAADWWEKNGWTVGCNYVPSTAINQIEMWQEDTFDPFLIDKELSWAASLNFNSVRVFLHHLLWEEDPQRYLYRIDQFLHIAAKHKIKPMLVFFDAVWNPHPQLGAQPAPKLNIHNSGWVQCPGFNVLNDPNKYDGLKSYVQGIVGHFKNDERVLMLDLFNEPDNINIGSYKDDSYCNHKAELSLALLKKTVQWVREIDPIQPITMAPWQGHWHDAATLTRLDRYMFSNSDVISFHCYENKSLMEQRILTLKRYNRPLVCTEYMARPFDCTFEEIMPLFKAHGVGAYNWGLVAGRSQTHCPWDSWQHPYDSEPPLWFHDIFRPNGEPYLKSEVEFIKACTSKKKEELTRVA